ncbi:MAG TPA: transglutaminase family protein [Pirellulales bacterium]|nr:transglutaminase family protein [Pirellulales bacterium]
MIPAARAWACCLAVVMGLGVSAARGDDDDPQSPAASKAENALPEKDSLNVEEVYQRARPSLAVISVRGGDGRPRGLGSGFVISADGLIATNMHVIGANRPIEVQLASGKRYDVTAIHAFDRHLDLAILRIDARGLQPLPLGDSEQLRAGQAVVALGNPQGLRHSVVSGVVSGMREIDGRSMIQLAIPIEPGNSGGPLLDMQGRVEGILTLKSTVTSNLGFAVAINDLKPLVAKPNPVPIAQWLKQGALDPDQWQVVMGANWRTRGGRILVDGEGDGFGGRALCLWRESPPQLPYEVSVNVRLDDEAGAAGLVFAADGQDKHYGFYPSGGGLRLTRFDGPDLVNWTILSQQTSAHYRPGEFNKLHVRVEAARIVCSVNDQVVVTWPLPQPLAGQVGLAKFRDTHAEFKNFQLAKELARPATSTDIAARVDKLLTELPVGAVPNLAFTEQLTAGDDLLPAALVERAERLTRQARQLRVLSGKLREAKVIGELEKLLAQPDDRADLLTACLCVAQLDNEDVDAEFYRRLVERMAAELKATLPEGAEEAARLAALDKFFFEESGFHGSRTFYYQRANSYINDVLDDRQGLPITLSVIYIELAKRLGLKVDGVGLPGHFVVRFTPEKGDSRLIDVFDGGQVISDEEAAARVLEATKTPLLEEHKAAITKRAIVARILHNLINVAQRQGDEQAVLRYLDALLAITPESHRERFMRAVLRWQTGEHAGARQDADYLLEHEAPEIDLDRLRDFRAILERGAK